MTRRHSCDLVVPGEEMTWKTEESNLSPERDPRNRRRRQNCAYFEKFGYKTVAATCATHACRRSAAQELRGSTLYNLAS